jgi:uncharacterized protein (TIGR03067 family)
MIRIEKLVLVMGLALVGIGFTAAADYAVADDAAADGAVAEAMKKIEGTWRVVSRIIDGEKAPQEELKDRRLVIKDGTWTRYEGEEVAGTGTFKIVGLEKDHFKSDFVNKDAPDTVYEDITRVEGDTLTICYAPAGKGRPTVFESKPGSEYRLTVFKREK